MSERAISFWGCLICSTLWATSERPNSWIGASMWLVWASPLAWNWRRAKRLDEHTAHKGKD